jgi:acetylornithine/N-succinyldiaminopimelate aminotransferase
MQNNNDFKDNFQITDQKYYLPVFKRYPVTLKKAKGAYIWDVNNNKYIDALAGIAVNSIGHCHPNVVKAISKQAKQLMQISNSFLSIPQALLSEKLVNITGLNRVFFANSGAEANEAAFKLARKYAHNNGRGGTIIYMDECFHGRTLATLATGKEKYKKGFEPIPSGFIEAKYNDINSIKNLINNDIAAIIIELVQGEGGLRSADFNFVKQIREICDKENILLIIDEIQTGMGRTGKMFAFEHYGIKPDILTLAKALGGGFPVSAALFDEKIAGVVKPGDHGTTFGGNPLACAAALASVNTIIDLNLPERAAILGDKARNYITQKIAGKPYIKEVRGKGLMLGIVITFPGRPVVERMLQKGVIGNFTADTVLRLVPPLIIKEKDLFKVIDILIETIDELKPNE